MTGHTIMTMTSVFICIMLLVRFTKGDHQRAVMSVHVWNSGRKRAAPFVHVQ